MHIKPWWVHLAQSVLFLLTSSSGEEARCCACRLEQEVCQESELFVYTFLGPYILQGKNPVCFDVSCFLNVPVPLYFCPEKLQFNSLANQQMSFVFSHGTLAALVLVRPKPRGLHLQGKSSQVTLMSFLGTRRFDLFLSL